MDEKRLASAHPSRQSFNAAIEHIRLHAPMTLATENALTIIEAYTEELEKKWPGAWRDIPPLVENL